VVRPAPGGLEPPAGIGTVAPRDRSASFDAEMPVAAVGRGRARTGCRAGQILFSQGDAADSIFYIVRGKVKIVVTSERGKEAMIAMLGEGDFFGEACLIGQPLRPVTAIAMTESTLIRFDKAEMRRVLDAESDFAEMFTLHLLARKSRAEADLADHLLNSSEKRLARILLLLANFDEAGKPEPITTRITQEMLAEMVGTTRPRVSFFMNKFRKLGFIDYHGTLVVHRSLFSVLLER
jgi:CRP/FNR family cyclic AMP-dependent transcriptional regulator